MNTPELIRWINASVNKHFDALRNGKKMYIEGQEIDLLNEAECFELRVSGIRINEISKDHFHVDMDLNIMCSCKLGDNDYAIHDLVGLVYDSCKGPIDVKKYGIENDPYIACFRLREDLDSPREIIPWGLVQVTEGPLRVNQTSVEAFYLMEIST